MSALVPRAPLVLAALILLCGRPDLGAQVEPTEASIAELQAAMADGRTTAAELTAAFLARIAAYDQAGPRLNAVIRLNPRALEEAAVLDAERRSRGARGPLHGIPVILKDNYDVAGLPTSAGSLALAALVPPDDAHQVRRLREAGAVLLGKSNMHELASGITTIGSLGGQTLNPYDPSRNPGGSSGGTGAAIAASFAVVGWGSDTCGSIRIPAAHNNLVGLRPTKGLSSIDGIAPLSVTQDVGGPLARTVGDLAVALDATVGADPADPATELVRERGAPRFVDALDEGALRGARIGVLTASFGSSGDETTVSRLVRAALGRMAAAGADTVTVEIPGLDSLVAGSSVIGHEFKWNLADYLAAAAESPVSSLAEILERGLVHEALAPLMRLWVAPTERDTEAYRTALAKRAPLRDAVVAVLDAHRLDALAYPTLRTLPAHVHDPQRGSNCQLAASSGLPALALPAGFSDGGLPVGLELLGRPLDDARLVRLGYAWEQVDAPRRAPTSTPPLVDGRAPAPLTWEVVATGGAHGGDVPSIRASLELDRVAGTLGYALEVVGAAAADVTAVVLRAPDAEGRWSVRARLSGPGVLTAEGAFGFDAELRSRLDSGEVRLELFTHSRPLGAAAATVRPPDRGSGAPRPPPGHHPGKP